jgi:hypothetical protein
MAQTITGKVGTNFNLTVAETATSCGSKSVVYKCEDTVREVTYASTDKVVAWAGQVGTTGTTLDLYAIADANDGTYYMRVQDTPSGVSLSGVRAFVVHNKAAAGTIKILVGAANSFLPASEQATVQAGSSIMYAYPATGGQTVTAAIRNLKLTGSAINMDCEVYLIGV